MTFILDADRTCIYISTTQKLIIDSFQVILNLTSYLLNRFIKIKCILKYKERVIIHDKQKRDTCTGKSEFQSSSLNI